jgi:hypothetical protein
MLVSLKRPLYQGEHIKDHIGTVKIEYDVEGMGDQQRPQ